MILHYIYKFVCCKSQIKLKQDKEFRPHSKFKKGNERLEQELDIVNILKSMRKLKSLVQFLLPARRRILLKFSKQNLIQTSSSSSDSDYYKNDIIKHLNGNNQFEKLAAIVRIKKALSHFKDNAMDENDKILLKGIFIKGAKDFHDKLVSTPLLKNLRHSDDEGSFRLSTDRHSSHNNTNNRLIEKHRYKQNQQPLQDEINFKLPEILIKDEFGNKTAKSKEIKLFNSKNLMTSISSLAQKKKLRQRNNNQVNISQSGQGTVFDKSIDQNESDHMKSTVFQKQIHGRIQFYGHTQELQEDLEVNYSNLDNENTIAVDSHVIPKNKEQLN
ncbi:UNKNOWN [Stylonychia lemnae]|uniref:Uncharacterized protein n=1 Tax=Stylonychia lemnae TaxID=5949 RepID=A0A077ZPM9_STYLE|nr:UNKNOWN [Stylonychia lemnae]|eukprot:CDW71922.1 UNKNOWN [Stylonychia lemnae]